MLRKKGLWRKQLLKGMGLVVAFSFILGLFPLVGFGQEKIDITWSEWWRDEWGGNSIDWIMATFEEKHPNVRIVDKFWTWDKTFDKLISLAAVGDPPDVFGMELEFIQAFDRVGLVQALDARLAEDTEFKDSVLPPAFIQWKGDTYQIHLYLMAYFCAYNVDTFNEKGLTPPSSWDHLKYLLAKLKDPAAGKYGMALQLSYASFHQLILRIFMTPLIQFGGSFLDAEGYPLYNSDAGVRALEYYQNLIDEDLVYPGALQTSETEMYDMIGAGDAQMMWTGPWVRNVVKVGAPDVNMVIPPPWKDVTGGYVASGSGIGLSAMSKNQDMAWEFLKHLYSDEVSIRLICEFATLNPTYVGFSQECLKDSPMLKYQPEMLANPASEPWRPVPEMDDLYRSLAENIHSFYSGQKTAREALDDAAAYWTKVIDEFNASN